MITNGTAESARRASITTGITGSAWRASITPWGAIEPWDDARALDWYVAADDRWHVPANEPSVRQTRLDGTPVTETRVRVPNGDVVQRIVSVPDGGGLTVVEVENESTMPVAIAFGRSDVLTERPIADIPIEGIDLPAGAFVLPLGHRATLRVGLAHGDQRTGRLPTGIPAARQVANGWLATVERASRLVLPEGADGRALAERVTAARCEVALGGIPAGVDDPVGFAIALGELVRMGEGAHPWLLELADAVEAIGPTTGWLEDQALVAAGRILTAAGEDRAGRDLARSVAGRTMSRRPDAVPAAAGTDLAAIPWLETRFADGGELLPGGFPPSWPGQSFEVYGVPTGPQSTVSFAIRWHGARPAILWEQSGTPIGLTASVVAPDWASGLPQGEALWPPVA